MSVLLMPLGNDAPFVDSNGNPLSGGLLYFYTAGSSTPQDTFTTSAGNVANANPVVLGSTGYPTVSNAVVEIWGTSGVQYKAVLKTSAGVTLWTRDNLQLINDTSVAISEWVSGPTPTYIAATQFSLVGDQTSTFQVGRRVKTTNSGGTIYSTISVSAFGAVTTVTVVNDSGTLDSGLSAVSYGLLSATNPAIPTYAGKFTNITASGNMTVSGNSAITGNETVGGNITVTGRLTGTSIMLSPITASLAANVALNNTSNYFNGPSVNQGTSGTWVAMGTITAIDTAGAARFDAKLWDGTTVKASSSGVAGASGQAISITLAGLFNAPAGNIRIDVKDATSTSGSLLFNQSLNSLDCTITAVRIG